MDVSDVRRHHLSLVLGHLVRHGARSRARLAQDTGLAKATVSALVADLLERGLVEEVDTPRGGRVGRPHTDVAVSGDHVGGLGLAIEVDHVAACLVDLTGAVRAEHRLSGDHRAVGATRVVGRLRRATERVLADAERLGVRPVGATVALPGLIDPATGTLHVAPNLHWFDADLASVTGRLGLPAGVAVTADNEANLGALAELRSGAGRDRTSFAYVSAGVGIGAGLVVDGRLVRGAHGFAGELGHVVVDPGGRRCACGARGCLETVAGRGRRSSRAAVAAALTIALRSVVHLLDPEVIVLGGRFAEWGAPFAGEVEAALAECTLGARWHPCAVVPSDLGPAAALRGAATVALDAVLADPTLVAPVGPTGVATRPSTRSA